VGSKKKAEGMLSFDTTESSTRNGQHSIQNKLVVKRDVLHFETQIGVDDGRIPKYSAASAFPTRYTITLPRDIISFVRGRRGDTSYHLRRSD